MEDFHIFSLCETKSPCTREHQVYNVIVRLVTMAINIHFCLDNHVKRNFDEIWNPTLFCPQNHWTFRKTITPTLFQTLPIDIPDVLITFPARLRHGRFSWTVVSGVCQDFPYSFLHILSRTLDKSLFNFRLFKLVYHNILIEIDVIYVLLKKISFFPPVKRRGAPMFSTATTWSTSCSTTMPWSPWWLKTSPPTWRPWGSFPKVRLLIHCV